MTVTRSEIGAGVTPDVVAPNDSAFRSSASERTGCTSTSTAASARADDVGVVDAPHGSAVVAEFRGAGAAAVKSASLAFVSAQPPEPRTAAVGVSGPLPAVAPGRYTATLAFTVIGR